MNISYSDLKVSVHSHKLDAPIDITDRVTSISYSRMVKSPFEAATVVLANYGDSPFFSMEGSKEDPLFRTTPKNLPSVDFWLVIMKSEEVLFWGYVSSIRTSLRARGDGLIESPGLTLSVSSWASLLSKCAIALTTESEGTARNIEGAFYNFEDWGSRFKTLADGISVPYLGETMEKVLAELLGPKLPSTLASKNVSNLLKAVTLVYNKATQDSVNPERDQPISAVIGSNITGFLAGATLARQSIWSLLQAAFNPSSNIIELFPSFEQNTVAGPVSFPCVPTLVYRMKPLDPDVTLSDFDNGTLNKVYGSTAPGESSLPLPGKDVIKREGTGSYKEIDVEKVLGVNFAMSDDNRLNAVWVESPFLGNKRILFSTFARAAINYPDVEEYGARIFDVKWPLFPAAGARESAYKNLEAVIDYAYLVYGDGENYMNGSIALSPELGFAPGEWYSIRGLDKNAKDKRFTFYVTGAAHRITVSSATGNIEAHTEITYERGSFERLPSVPRVDV